MIIDNMSLRVSPIRHLMLLLLLKFSRQLNQENVATYEDTLYICVELALAK